MSLSTASRVIAAGGTDVGRKRQDNEDRIYLDPERGAYLVADGLGGHAAGERAAQIAVDIIRSRLERHTATLEQRIREAFALASTEIYRQASEDKQLSGMACVATLAVIENDQVTVGHVGDSRLYVLEPGSIRKVTSDHSPVGELEDGGQLSEKAAMRHPRRNEVYRDLGSHPHSPDDPGFVDVFSFELKPRSALLLCSDGLSDQVTAADIMQIVERDAGNPDAAVRALIEAANAAGGKDNVSVVLVETSNYASQEHADVESERTRSAAGWVWFLAGVLTALACLYAVRHFYPRTTTQEAHAPRTLRVGEGALGSIGEALKEAAPGDTVIVASGEYTESLRVPSGVSVISAELHGAKIRSGGTAVVFDHVQQARLAGFEIDGPGSVGVAVLDSDVELTNLVVTGMSEAAVDISGESSGTLQASNLVGNPGAGVRVHGVARPVISHNVISGNGHGATLQPGISVEGSAAPRIVNNVIARNGAEQLWLSPLFHDTRLLSDNLISPEARNRSRLIKVVTR